MEVCGGLGWVGVSFGLAICYLERTNVGCKTGDICFLVLGSRILYRVRKFTRWATPEKIE